MRESMQYQNEFKNEYRVLGQDALCLKINQGESLAVSSIDGCQGCELIVIPKANVLKPLLLKESGIEVNQSAAGESIKLLNTDFEASKKLRKKLDSWNVGDDSLEKAYCFSAGELPNVSLQQDANVILVAAAQKMAVNEHEPPTELNVIHYANSPVEVPEPLAEPIQEIYIPHSSARTYEVKAGQWIQIIDLQGKQSSDFVAFDKNALGEGREILIDPTATRTVMGLKLPTPGLYSKFMDQEQQTLLEVVQDTVGRHDSFLFACSPKYYEDKGYFGHLSCTENFNNVLKPYGVKPRFGWPAINFFFNTSSEPCGEIEFSEPWSNPGDYVLMRAARDLLCASSACPDDIDPANGWQPTDIHVRIYSEDEFFPQSIAYRTIPEELPRMTIKSGFHSRTSTLTRHFSEYKGYWMATEYEGWGANKEYLACREKVAMIDLTPLRKFEVVGPDAEVFLQYMLTRNVRRVSVGEIVYSAICNETGGMIDDGTLFKMSDQAFRWICGDPYTGRWLIDWAQKTGHNVKVRESTNQIHNVAVQGPKSRELLKELVWTPEHQTSIEDLAWFHFTIGKLGDAKGFPIMISRTGYTGELGFEVWCHPDDAEMLWDVIWEKGQKYGIAPMGFDALDKLRIEAGLIFADHEFCPKTNPFEAGIGFTTPLKTNDEDFIGRGAIESQSPESRHKLMGLTTKSNQPIHDGDEIYNGRFPVGVVTSTIFSPILKQQIALCRLAPGFSKVDTELEVGQLDGHKKRIAVKVVSLPFYDPKRTRVRS